MKKCFLFTMTLMMLSCGTDSDNGVTNDVKEQAPKVALTPGRIVLGEKEGLMVKEGNAFSFKLLNGVDKEMKGQSFVVSPMSVGYLLGMLCDGAKGTTQEEIIEILGFENASAEAINEYFGNMMVNSPLVDERVSITSANALFANSVKGIQFAKQYAADMKGYYLAGIESLDFTSTESSLNRINGWCNETTKGMIPSILSRDEFNAAGLAYLLNSIYFKADWTTIFDKEETVPSDFTTTEGKTLQLPMMHKQDNVQYMEVGDMKALAMPYGGGSYHMYVLLPNEGKTLTEAVGDLSVEKWTEMVDEMEHSVMGVDILMPKYETETDTDLASVLTTMGMRTAFTNEADYGNMLQTGDIYFDLMKQKARIEVSEEGTKAAAATIAGQVTLDEGGTDQEPQLPTFHATRPFLYIIMEQTTGAIFFMGIYSGE